MNKELIILVDEYDNELGLMEKLEAHQKGLLHRAFSVFLLNDSNQLLLQKRALNKYHSPGLWTNTCCSHPRDGESVINAGIRRLSEEMGFETELNTLFSFIYKAEFDNGLTEHEFDHVLLGRYNKNPLINKLEVSDWRWIDVELLKKDVVVSPYLYTVWFKIIFQQFHKKFK